MVEGLYSQLLIFFVTYERAEEARVLDYTRLERFSSNKHSFFIGTIHKFRRKWSVVNMVKALYSQPVIFFVTYDWAL